MNAPAQVTSTDNTPPITLTDAQCARIAALLSSVRPSKAVTS